MELLALEPSPVPDANITKCVANYIKSIASSFSGSYPCS